MHRLVRSKHVAGDEIAKGNGIDIKMCRLDVVGFVGIFVHIIVAIGDDDEIGVTAKTDGDIDQRRLIGIRLAGSQCASIGRLTHQTIVGTQGGVQREEDLVGPPAGGGGRPHVVDGIADGRAGAGSHVIGNGKGGDPQIRPIVHADLGGIRRDQGVVAAGRTEFVHLVTTAAQVGIGDHLDPVESLDLRRQADLLGTRVADSGFEAPVVGKAAEGDGITATIGGYQPDRIDP